MSTSTAGAVNNLVNASSASKTSNDKSRKTIADNYDAFLSLLTTQLKNQNPLEPLDANQFTQQLVQYSGVEQQLKSNDYLASIAERIEKLDNGGSNKLTAASAASLIGTRVSVDANKAKLTEIREGVFETRYPVTVQSNYSNYQVSIKDDTGREVYSRAWTPPGNGEQAFTWDGKNNNYQLVDTNKSYTITVVGETADGLKSVMSTQRSGVVESVDLSGPEETVQFGGWSMPMSQIRKVSKAL
jgi:flagellar basal-body rod modification protein FlgD